MLPTISAAFFFVSVTRSCRPRIRIGTISDSDGASMVWWNDVCVSVRSASPVNRCGSVSAFSSTFCRSAISGVRITFTMS